MIDIFYKDILMILELKKYVNENRGDQNGFNTWAIQCMNSGFDYDMKSLNSCCKIKVSQSFVHSISVSVMIGKVKTRYTIKDGLITFMLNEYYLVKKYCQINMLLNVGFTSDDLRLSVCKYLCIDKIFGSHMLTRESYRKIFMAGFTIEGFASPFNSGLLEFGGKYCSLFDSDIYSLGPFEDCKFENKCIYCFPEAKCIDILNKAIKSTRNCAFLVIIPVHLKSLLIKKYFNMIDVKIEVCLDSGVGEAFKQDMTILCYDNFSYKKQHLAPKWSDILL
jgi:hypothetical protein